MAGPAQLIFPLTEEIPPFSSSSFCRFNCKLAGTADLDFWLEVVTNATDEGMHTIANTAALEIFIVIFRLGEAE